MTFITISFFTFALLLLLISLETNDRMYLHVLGSFIVFVYCLVLLADIGDWMFSYLIKMGTYLL